MNDVEAKLNRELLALKATSIGRPASSQMISKFEREHGIVMHSGLRLFYSICNGLVSAGNLLISINDLGANKILKGQYQSDYYFLFGDIMLGSDDLAVDFMNPSNPVIMVASSQVLATNFLGLVGHLTT